MKIKSTVVMQKRLAALEQRKSPDRPVAMFPVPLDHKTWESMATPHQERLKESVKDGDRGVDYSGLSMPKLIPHTELPSLFASGMEAAKTF